MISVTPADGSEDVAISTPVVIVFDQDMNTTLAPFGALGNLAMSPANLAQTTLGTWGDDNRTLTLQPTFGPWPLNVTITWTLNPSGVNPFLALKSASGTQLATVSGSFSTGVGAPVLGSVSPGENAQAVPTNTPIVFRFNQAMKKSELPGGTPPTVLITGAGMDPANLTYQWAADGRSLTCTYVGGFPRSTVVSWALNPPGAPVPLESESGKPLASATYFGTFTTASTGECNVDPLATWGTYGVTRRGNYAQTSTANPVPDPEYEAPFAFTAVISSPALGAPVTAASLEFPDGTITNLTSFGAFSFFATFDTEEELLESYPDGVYTERFTQTGLPERVVPIQAGVEFPPVPKIANFTEAQSVPSTQPFVLRWEAFTGAGGDDFITLFIADEAGPVVFQAPNPCVPIELKPTDTSVVVPQNTLQTGRTYFAELMFAKSFLFTTNAFPTMYGFGFNFRSTRFPMKAEGGVGPADPAVLSNVAVGDNDRISFDLEGSPATAYKIQRADRLTATLWPEVGTATTDAAGKAEFEDGQALGSGPWFYRAVTP